MLSMKSLFVLLMLAIGIIATPAENLGARDDYGGPCKQCVSSPNNCDITAPCSNFLGKLYCACRPGYRASSSDDKYQWKISTIRGHEHRVWVAPGIACNDLCGDINCSEVPFKDSCKP